MLHRRSELRYHAATVPTAKAPKIPTTMTFLLMTVNVMLTGALQRVRCSY